MHSSRQEKYNVIINFFSFKTLITHLFCTKTVFLAFFCRIVSFQGNMRVYGSSSKCNRWFFKCNGNECSGPITIEAAVYNSWPSGSPNLLHHRSFEGYCENIPQGRVTVELWVGQCPSGDTLGDAHTGWESVSRIMIEEVSRAQS